MMKDKPAYKVDWVRVYQDPNKPEQKIGCSTPERPTRRYIEAHPHLYKTEHDKQPLKKIQRGHGQCVVGADGGEGKNNCGGPKRGVCSKKKQVCECLQGFTGPHCLASQASNPIVYDAPDEISDIGFIAPDATPSKPLIVLFGVAFVGLIAVMIYRRKTDGYMPIAGAVKHGGVVV